MEAYVADSSFLSQFKLPIQFSDKTELDNIYRGLCDFVDLVFKTESYQKKQREKWIDNLQENGGGKGSYSEILEKSSQEYLDLQEIEPYLGDDEDIYPTDKKTSELLLKN